jgi:site-specific DNA recombinase
VTGERIRDKIAASKRKGMWMGGPVPLGYDVCERKLVINDTEADTVRHIFRRYLELGSVVATAETLNRDGVLTKVTQTKDRLQRGGIAWKHGGLSHLLANRVYLGEVRHKEQHFPGEHTGIISSEVWDAVQAQLAGNRLQRMSSSNLSHNSLLRGLLYDGLGRRMQGAHANRGPKRYHYYVTNPADAKTTPGPSWRLPAPALEATVVQRLQAFLRNSASLNDAATFAGLPSDGFGPFSAKAAALAADIQNEPAAALKLLHRANLHDDRIELAVCLDPLLPTRTAEETPRMHQLSLPMSRQRRGREVRTVIGDQPNNDAMPADPALLKLIATARAAWIAMLAAADLPLATVAAAQGYSVNHFTLLLRLATLAPCIVQAIIEGRQPIALNRQRLATISSLPIEWVGQRAVLGFQ